MKSNSSVNNKLIAYNTAFLYLRMLFIMAVNLYAVRAILSLLGVVDYGLYNVIGGVVAMFSFLSSTMATASQRYFSIELAKNDLNRLTKCFSLNVLVYIGIIAVVFVCAESFGLYFINNQMTIPPERVFAANIVFQFSIAAFSVRMFAVPYTALVIAHEKMKAFAYIGIFEAVFKLFIVFVLSIITWDKLVVYGMLTLVSALIVAFSYVFFCFKHFQESHFKYYWNRNEAKELANFTGWHFLGTVSVIIRGDGVNLLINVFFSPAVNAARAIAYQVSSAVRHLNSNFFTAVKPQMYKAYGNNEIQEMINLILRSTIISVFLVSILSIPLLFNVQYVLSIWLKEVPDYAVVFTSLVLINGIIDATSDPAISPAIATGKIKKFYLITGTLYVLCLPIVYVFYKLGYSPEYAMFVSITLSSIAVVARAYLLIELIGFPFFKYLKLIIRIIFGTVIICAFVYIANLPIKQEFSRLIVSIVVSSLVHVLIYYTIILSSSDKKAINRFLHKLREKYAKFER